MRTLTLKEGVMSWDVRFPPLYLFPLFIHTRHTTHQPLLTYAIRGFHLFHIPVWPCLTFCRHYIV